MGLFVQSLSLATAQLKSTSDLLAAEVLAKKILAQRLSGQGDANLIEGVDPASRLNWSMASHLVKRTEGVADLTPIDRP